MTEQISLIIQINQKNILLNYAKFLGPKSQNFQILDSKIQELNCEFVKI